MSLTINTNISSIALTRNIGISYERMYKSLQKLASGYRINSAADGPAQLIISEQLRSQIASLSQKIENTSALIGKYSTASSTISGLRSQLTELRSLAIGAANEGINNEASQQAYVDSAQSIVNSYNFTADNAEYNGASLFDGSERSLGVVNSLENIDLSSAEDAIASIDTIDSAIAELDALQVDIGATQKNELEFQQASMEITRENLIAAESNMRSTDVALELSNFLTEQIKFQAGIAMMSHQFLMSNLVVKLLGSK